MDGDGDNRKRKLKLKNDFKEEEDEEDEEKKVEKFFALIKRAGEAHQYIIKTNEQERNKIKPWQPTFERQDFIQKDEHHHKLQEGGGVLMATHHQSAINATPPGPSKRKDIEPKGVADIHEDGLDLNLSL